MLKGSRMKEELGVMRVGFTFLKRRSYIEKIVFVEEELHL